MAPNPMMQALLANRDKFVIPQGPRCPECKSKNTTVAAYCLEVPIMGGKSKPYTEFGCYDCRHEWSKKGNYNGGFRKPNP